jgi:hypothetical protein
LNAIRRWRWAALAALFAFCRPALPAGAVSGQVWLAVSDIHLDFFDHALRPSRYGLDTNVALFESAVARMKSTVRDPAVVLISGDFLMHHLRKRAGSAPNAADEAGLQSMRWIAARLARAFPKSRFAVALGNNDIPCGDYRSAAGSRYLAQVARIWKPLVDRGGASPQFEESFARGGYYTATLPLPRLRLVVLDTVPFSTEYRGNCGGAPDPAQAELSWLSALLRATPRGTRNVVLMHVPPGFDAFATEYVQDLVAWPFLKARYQTQLLDALERPSHRILYAIAGHTHRFDFRLAQGVPIVVLGALSPIYNNNPAYYVLRVAQDGSLNDIDFHVFDDMRQTWSSARSFDRAWGLQRINGASLARLHLKIAASSAARDAWNRQASGWSAGVDDASEPWVEGWRVAWCTQEVLGSGFAACAGIEDRVRVIPAFVSLALVCAASLTFVLVLNRRLRAQI